MKTILIILTLLAANIDYAQGYGVIVGTVSDEVSYSETTLATVHFENAFFHDSIQTYPDGLFFISTLPSGRYSIRFTTNNQTDFYPDSVNIEAGSPDTLNMFQAFRKPVLIVKEVNICGCGPRYWYFPPENPEMNRSELLRNVNKFQIQGLLTGMSSRISEKPSGDLTMLGGTKNYQQFIDGVKLQELHSVPSATLSYITVYDGFIPAKYGDATGGIVVIETLGYFDLLRNWESRQH